MQSYILGLNIVLQVTTCRNRNDIILNFGAAPTLKETIRENEGIPTPWLYPYSVAMASYKYSLQPLLSWNTTYLILHVLKTEDKKQEQPERERDEHRWNNVY